MANQMKEIRIEKVVVNIGCGEPGEKLDKAKKMLEQLTGKTVMYTRTKKRTTFGTPKGRTIGVMVTLRGKEALDFVRRALDAVENKLPERVFDRQGNFSFGVKEHIDIAGVRYDPEIGIYGMDVSVRLERRGYRIMKKRNPSGMARQHRITPEEARKFAEEKLGAKVS